MRTIYMAFPLMLLAATSAGCASEVQAPDVALSPATLERAESCDHLVDMLRIDALHKMHTTINAQIYMIEKYWDDSITLSGGAPEANDSTGAGGGGGDAPPRHSETNTQVEGVDEADIVKTDGNFLYVLHGQQLEVISAFPVSDLAIQASVGIEGRPLEMFLRGEQIVVFSSVDAQPVYDEADVDAPADPYGSGYGYGMSDAYYYAPQLTKLSVIDLSGGGASLVKELYFEGSYSSSRRIDSHVRTVLTGSGRNPGVQYYPHIYHDDKDDIIASYERLRLDNMRRILEADLSDFVEQRFERKDGTISALSPACTSHYVPTAGTTSDGFTSIQSIDLDDLGAEPVETSVSGATETVYSSKDGLYVAARGWNQALSMLAYESSVPMPLWLTHIHKFDIASDPAHPAYVASTSISGHIHDQFSLDERDGVLRVAVTDERTSATSWETSTALHTLDENLDHLATISGLAPDEQIYSTRFVGDRGYVVTFRQVDPLFVFDLADPKKPALLAELKIPGFSSYMHPIEDGKYLLTVGRDATDEGQVLDPALQIFDVSDPTAPALIHKHVLPDGWTEAEMNHKAFTYFEGMLALPLSRWYDGYGASTLEVFAIDVVSGITPIGSVDHSQFDQGIDQQQYYCGYYAPGVRRGVFIDDYVYSISERGVIVSALDGMTSVASLALPATPAVDDCYY